jgi:hypothetical protein
VRCIILIGMCYGESEANSPGLYPFLIGRLTSDSRASHPSSITTYITTVTASHNNSSFRSSIVFSFPFSWTLLGYIVGYNYSIVPLLVPSTNQRTNQPAMRLGFSLSSGGLLLPYHLGVLDCLKDNGVLTPETPIAGASAGSIAIAAHACSIDSKLLLDDTMDISQKCQELGRARGNLLPLLREKLEHRVDQEHFHALLERPGETVISYHEVFPYFRPIHQVDFAHKEELIRAVCHSSTFPFFASNWPVALDHEGGTATSLRLFGQDKTLVVPRLVVDGYFAVPGNRFGCPDFDVAGVPVDRTVLVSVFPREVVGLKHSISRTHSSSDIICPDLVDDGLRQSASLLRLATQPSKPIQLMSLYENGYKDAERWCRNEENELAELGRALRTGNRMDSLAKDYL